MAGETVITIIGNLTADPEIRTLNSGGTVCSFTIASTPRNYNRQTGQYEDGQTLFLRCSAWRDLATHCAQSLAKGMRVIAQGRLQQRSYQAQDGSNRTVFELQVDEIGPSLRYATAQVQRQTHANPGPNGGTGFGNGGFQGGGYAGGATGFAGNQQQAQQQPQQQAQYGVNPSNTPQTQASDPWAGGGQPAFNNGGDGEPEF